MKFKITSKHQLLTIMLAGLAILPAFLVYFVAVDYTQSGSSEIIAIPPVIEAITPVHQIDETDANLPIRLTIPIINVNANIEHVGLTAQGAVGAPNNFSNVAWFNLWPRPGENGNAIISGHYGIKNGKPSVFDNLHKLKRGDKLYVEDSSGAITTFIVRTIRRYNPNAIVPEVFNSTDSKSHLNIITCEGIWDTISKNYSKRLIVFTDKE